MDRQRNPGNPLPVATPPPDSADAPSRLRLWLLSTLVAGVSPR